MNEEYYILGENHNLGSEAILHEKFKDIITTKLSVAGKVYLEYELEFTSEGPESQDWNVRGDVELYRTIESYLCICSEWQRIRWYCMEQSERTWSWDRKELKSQRENLEVLESKTKKLVTWSEFVLTSIQNCTPTLISWMEEIYCGITKASMEYDDSTAHSSIFLIHGTDFVVNNFDELFHEQSEFALDVVNWYAKGELKYIHEIRDYEVLKVLVAICWMMIKKDNFEIKKAIDALKETLDGIEEAQVDNPTSMESMDAQIRKGYKEVIQTMDDGIGQELMNNVNVIWTIFAQIVEREDAYKPKGEGAVASLTKMMFPGVKEGLWMTEKFYQMVMEDSLCPEEWRRGYMAEGAVFLCRSYAMYKNIKKVKANEGQCVIWVVGQHHVEDMTVMLKGGLLSMENDVNLFSNIHKWEEMKLARECVVEGSPSNN